MTAAAYVGIAFFIIRGLVSTHQLIRNHLALATAAIFITCAAHHLLHALDLFGGDAMHLSMMRELMGHSLDVLVTGSTAVTGVLYLGLRRSYGMLMRSPDLFDNATEIRYRQLAANLPHTGVFVFDKTLRYVLVGGGLPVVDYQAPDLEGKLISETLPTEILDEIRALLPACGGRRTRRIRPCEQRHRCRLPQPDRPAARRERQHHRWGGNFRGRHSGTPDAATAP